ncbi:MAG TPA: sensor domain-containing diguanylate cyclase [Polyangia bacterium]|nr:sensor domain-containing diguanylate cyclase [Polyangia bacterium]
MARLDELASIVDDVRQRDTVAGKLQTLVSGAASLLAIPRVGMRLIDPAHGRLSAVARAGAPLHAQPGVEFGLGEGLVGWVAAERRPLVTGDAESDARFVQRRLMRDRLGSFVGVPLLTREDCFGVLYGSHGAPDHFTHDDELTLALLAGLCAPHIETARLEQLTRHDALTGALNRRGAQPLLEASVPMCAVLCDLDHFKHVNDAHGHLEGDAVLARAAELLTDAVRAEDMVVRWGGEEFLLLLPRIDLMAAAGVAARARRAIAAETFTARGLRITMSIGVAERRGPESVEAVIRRADAALYRAKSSGRNQVRIAR